MTEFWIAFKVYLFVPLLWCLIASFNLHAINEKETAPFNNFCLRFARWSYAISLIWLTVNITMWVMSK